MFEAKQAARALCMSIESKSLYVSTVDVLRRGVFWAFLVVSTSCGDAKRRDVSDPGGSVVDGALWVSYECPGVNVASRQFELCSASARGQELVLVYGLLDEWYQVTLTLGDGCFSGSAVLTSDAGHEIVFDAVTVECSDLLSGQWPSAAFNLEFSAEGGWDSDGLSCTAELKTIGAVQVN